MLDLTNHRYGRLFVNQYKEHKNKKIFWLCTCDCGNITTVSTSSLRSGKTKSCGCLVHDSSKHRIKDLTDKRVGSLLVLSMSDRTNKSGNKYWNCLCDCGNTTVIMSSYLSSGHTKSCGHCNNIDCVGKIYGKLLVSKEYSKIGNKIKYLCKCDCGNECVVSCTNIVRGITNSCGCLLTKKQSDSPTWKGYKEISGTVWARIKSCAKSRNISFNITIEEAWEQFLKQKKRCALTNIKLSFPKTSENINYFASLDRIDSLKPYHVDNIQWVHSYVNFIKGKMLLSDLLYWVNLINKPDKSLHRIIIPEVKHAHNWKGIGLINGTYISITRCGAKNRNLEFNITIQDIWNLFLKQYGRCSITNLPIFFKDGVHVEQTASLDRINPLLGYTVDNIQWVHKKINLMKWDLQQNEFIKMCKLISKKFLLSQ